MSRSPRTIEPSGMRRILPMVREQWRGLATGFVFLVVSSIAELLFPLLVKRIIDESLRIGGSQRVDRLAAMMTVVLVTQGLGSALRYYYLSLAGERIIAKLRVSLYDSLLAQDVAFFDSTRTGELVSRLASDTTVLQNAVSVNLSTLFRNLAVSVGGFGMLIYTSSTLTLVLLLGMVPFLLAVAMFGKIIHTCSRAVQDRVAETSAVAEATIGGIRTVRAFAQESREQAHFGAAMRKVLTAARTRAQYIAAFMGVSTLVGYSVISGIVWYGGRQISAQHMTVGALTSFVIYTLTVVAALGSLGSLWTEFMSAAGASRRVFELMDRRPAIPRKGGQTLHPLHGRIELRNVRFSYPSHPEIEVLRGIDLQIDPGEVVALVGPSGSGKSTIAHLLARFYDPDQGSVLVDGQDLRVLDVNAYHRQLGVVAQEPVLLSATIDQNIRYGSPTASPDEVKSAAALAYADRFIESFPASYETMVGERGVQLSGGQKQRIAIARAALRNPRILVLDEATSALDAESEHLVKAGLRRLMADRTTLLISHRVSAVKDAHRIIVMEAGRIVQAGRHVELMQDVHGAYRKLVERQHLE